MTIDLIHLLILIIVANAAPILIRQLLSNKYNFPLDGGKTFFDGYPVLGSSVTWRGLIAALICTGLLALILSYSLVTGLLVAFYAMLGDLLASFIKRRLAMPPSSMAPFLDQVPESLMPAIFLRHQFGLDWQSIFVLVVLFVVLELALSYLFYKFGVRRHPY